MMKNNLGKIGLIGRFKPLHNGNSALLESACENSSQVLIGIGSSNRYDLINPFTAIETEGMIRAVLSPNYSNFEIFYIPDFRDDEKWRNDVREKFGNLDYFVSGNQYVAQILKESYRILHPFELIPEERQLKLNSTEVRIEIAKGEQWKDLVPAIVAEYLENSGLIERFRREFGEQTLFYPRNKFDRNAEDERMRILNGVNQE